jgi:hypothetical protein
MFNHYHYWPEFQAYQRQEALLKQARLEHLLRQEQSRTPGLAARLGAALGSAFRRSTRPVKSDSGDEFELNTLAAERSQS